MARNPKREARRKVDDSSDNEEDISGDDVDQESYSSSGYSADQEPSEELDSFIDDGDVAPNARAIYREQMREDSEEVQYRRGQFLQNIDIDENVEEIIKPLENDPYLFRIPVRQGTNLACIAEMTNILVKGEHAKNSEFPLFTAEVFGLMANPNDPNYVYVEAHSQDQVELLACQASLKKYILPFRHYYSKQPVLSKPTIIHELRQVQRQEQGNVCSINTRVQKKILRNHYYVIKRFGFRNIYGGQLCRVYAINDQTIRVLTLARARSFDNSEVVQPHRFTKEMYQEQNDADAYETEYTTQSGVYFQGLLVLDVKESNLREPLIQELAQRSELQLLNQRSHQVEILPELASGDAVVIKDFAYKVRNQDVSLEGQFGSVLYQNGNFVEVQLSEHSLRQLGGLADLKIVKIPRSKVNKYVKEGSHVRIAFGEYENVVGTLLKIFQIDGKFVVEILTDYFDEVLDKHYQITTDYLQLYDTPYTGFERRKFNNVLFQRNQLVKLPSGVDALITNLSFLKAAVCTVDNEQKYFNLSDLQPVFQRSLPIFRDGQKPPQAVSVGSRVRIVDTDQTGQVLAVTYYSVSYILFVKILTKGRTEQLGVLAVDSKKTVVEDLGSYVRRKLDSKNELWIGRRVTLRNPRFMGREGVIIGTEGDDFFKVKLAEMDVSVRRYYIYIVEKKSQEETQAHTQRIGASQQLSLHSQYGFNESQYAAAANSYDTQGDFTVSQTYQGDYNMEDYGGFEGN